MVVRSRRGFVTLIKEEAHEAGERASSTAPRANKAADADAALQELGEDSSSFGYFTATVTVWDQDLEHARRKMQASSRPSSREASSCGTRR